MKLCVSSAELTQLLTFLEGNMATSRRLQTIEETAAALKAQVDALAAQVAALEPANPQLAADVDALKAGVADLNTILDVQAE